MPDLQNDSKISMLIPERHRQYDLFICDVADAAIKNAMQLMEHPFYALSKKPDTVIRRYEHNGNWIEIIPSVKGLATIYDKDILIYCISQVMAKLRKGEEVSARVRIRSNDLLAFTNRGCAGKDYQALCEAIDRLAGTRIRTNIKTGGNEETSNFGLIEASTIKRKCGLDGRLLYCDVTLSSWVFNAIEAEEVLTLHRDYFRLRRPIERRVYELARKHCGLQKKWRCSLEVMHRKSGSKSSIREFRRSIRHLVQHDHLPDYQVDYEEDTDMIVFHNRNTMPSNVIEEFNIPPLPAEAYIQARENAKGWDVYSIEQEWRAWCQQEDILPRQPAAHYLKFLQSWIERRGRAG